jgi:hypothetical protein
MAQPSLSSTSRSQTSYADVPVRTDAVGTEALASGVSWPAVAGGAFVTAALSLILLALGAGLGLSSVSPWSNVGASASTISTAAIVWLIFMQIASGAMGGYLAGRLRTKWASLHTDEVYFRDTAHGFLSWAVAFVVTAAFLTTAATFMVGAAAASAAGAGAAAGVQANAQQADANGYFVDALFRSTNAQPDPNIAPARAEAARILAYSAKGDVSAADRGYLAQMVAARTGLSRADAERRVSEVVTAEQQAAETARKVTAHGLLWMFLALLIGAFCASFAATIGGRQRDQVVVV